MTATFCPPVRLPGVISSMIVSVNARPAEGPLTGPGSIVTSTGKSSLRSFVAGTMPTWGFPFSSPRFAGDAS